MIDLGVLPGFVAVILVFLLPPGPDMAFMIAVGLSDGRRAAVRAILGIGTGMSIYAVAVVAGLGAVAESAPTVLDGLKLLGSAYLAWLGVVTLRHAHHGEPLPGGDQGARAGRAFRRGVIISLANPKVMLFFLAVLPQFVGDADDTTAQLALLGATNVLAEVLLYGTIGLVAGGVRARTVTSRRRGAMLERLAGVVYLGLAVIIAAETLTAHLGSG